MKRLRKTIVVKRCLVTHAGVQCDLPYKHGGDFHGAGDTNNGRIQWGHRAVAKPLTDDEVLVLVNKHPGDADFIALAKSHETLRNELERVNRIVDVAVVALGKLRRGTA